MKRLRHGDTEVSDNSLGRDASDLKTPGGAGSRCCVSAPTSSGLPEHTYVPIPPALGERTSIVGSSKNFRKLACLVVTDNWQEIAIFADPGAIALYRLQREGYLNVKVPSWLVSQPLGSAIGNCATLDVIARRQALCASLAPPGSDLHEAAVAGSPNHEAAFGSWSRRGPQSRTFHRCRNCDRAQTWK